MDKPQEDEKYFFELNEKLDKLESYDAKISFLAKQRAENPQQSDAIELIEWNLSMGRSPSSLQHIPNILGDFEIESKIGEGGMGSIYLAKQNPFDRKVVIKTMNVPRHPKEQPESYRRKRNTARRLFRREQAILAKLHLTNVIPIYAGGKCEQVDYFAMPYIRGKSLHQVLHNSQICVDRTSSQPITEVISSLMRNETVPDTSTLLKVPESQNSQTEPYPVEAHLDETVVPHTEIEMKPKPVEEISGGAKQELGIESVIELIVDLLSSLEIAHKQGVVHRDIKPANIMIREDGQAFLIDFGVAQLINAYENETAPIGSKTEATSIGGTLLYMAPEHRRGQACEQSDVWSLGVILYELLAGKKPFDSKSVFLNQPPAHPSNLNNTAPRELASICLKALQPDLAKRFQSAKDLAEELQKWLKKQRVSCHKYSQTELLTKWCDNNRRAVAFIAALSLLALIAIFFAYQAKSLSAKNISIANTLKSSNEKLESSKKAVDANNTLLAKRNEQITAQIKQLEIEQKRRTLLQAQSSIDGANLAVETEKYDAAKKGIESAFEFLESIEAPTTPANIAFGVNNLLAPEPLSQIQLPNEALVAQSFSPDGSLGLFSSIGNSFWLYDLATGSQLQQFDGHTGTVLCHAISPDNKKVASGSEDRTVRFWDAETGEQISILKGSVAVSAISFSANGERLFAGTGQTKGQNFGGITARFSQRPFQIDRTTKSKILVVNAQTGKIETVLNGHRGAINSLHSSADGKFLISGSNDGTIRFWNVAEKKEIFKFSESSAEFYNQPLQTKKNSDLRKRMQVVGIESKLISSLMDKPPGLPPSAIKSVVLAPDNLIAMGETRAGTLLFCDLKTGKSTIIDPEIVGLASGLQTACAIRNDFALSLIATRDGFTRLFDPTNGKISNTLTSHTPGERVNCVDFLGRSMICTGSDGLANLWSIRPARTRSSLGGAFLDSLGRPEAQSFSISSDFVLGCSSDGIVRVWDLHSGIFLRCFNEQADSNSRILEVSANQQFAVIAKEKLILWDVDSGTKLADLSGHEGDITSISISGDNKRLASGSTDGTVRIWDLEKRTSIQVLPHPKQKKSPSIEVVQVEGRQVLLPPTSSEKSPLVPPRIAHVEFSADGKRLLVDAGSLSNGKPDDESKLLYIWNVETQEKTPLEKPKDSTTLGRFWSFSKTGDQLVSWRNLDSAKSEFTFWNAITGKLSRSIAMQSPNGVPVMDVAFTEDGKHIAAVMRDGTLKLYGSNSNFAIFESKLLLSNLVISAEFKEFGNILYMYLSNGDLQTIDFRESAEIRSASKLAASAMKTLQRNPEDGKSAKILGKWYLKNSQMDWAKRLLKLAKKSGESIDAELGFAESFSSPPNMNALKELKIAESKSPYAAPVLAFMKYDHDQIVAEKMLRDKNVFLESSENQKRIFVSGASSPTHLVDIQADQIQLTVLPNISGTPIAFSGNGKLMTGRSSIDSLMVLDIDQMQLSAQLDLEKPQQGIISLAMASDGNLVLAGTRQGKLLGYSFNAEGQTVGQKPYTRILDVPAPSDFAMRARSENDKLKKWQAKLARVGTELLPNVHCFDLDESSMRVAAGYGIGGAKIYPGYVQLVDIKSQEVTYEKYYDSLVESIAVSNAANWIAVSTVDGKIELIDPSKSGDGSVVHTFSGHIGSVRSLSFSADAKILVSGGADQTVRIWDLEQKRLIKILRRHTSPISNAIILADKRILSASRGGELVLWKNPLQEK